MGDQELEQMISELDDDYKGLVQMTNQIKDIGRRRVKLQDETLAEIEGLDFKRIRESLQERCNTARERCRQSQEMKNQAKSSKIAVELKLVNLKNEIEHLHEEKHQLEQEIKNPPELPLVLELFK